jgi:hypothetical protein
MPERTDFDWLTAVLYVAGAFVALIVCRGLVYALWENRSWTH